MYLPECSSASSPPLGSETITLLNIIYFCCIQKHEIQNNS